MSYSGPKYSRNPETGIYEHNAEQIVQKTELINEVPPLSTIALDFDDMLKNLDDMVKSSSRSRQNSSLSVQTRSSIGGSPRRSLQISSRNIPDSNNYPPAEPLDFNSMTQSLDDLLSSVSNTPRKSMEIGRTQTRTPQGREVDSKLFQSSSLKAKHLSLDSIMDQEQKEMEKSRRELSKLKAEKREANKREAAMVDPFNLGCPRT